jgi:hypothetical protein
MTRKCNSLHCAPDRRTGVYRLYNRDERLLYAGIAYDTDGRWREHARDKPWWGDVHWRTVVWHSSRLGAAIEEYCAIKYENPIHNKRRDYDQRLGREATDTPGNHEPRPWRLGLLASAMKHPRGGTAWRDANPHYAAVICADQQDQASRGRVRIWFPQIPHLGYWNCGPMKDLGAIDDLYRRAARILAWDYELLPGFFTLSIHNADGCPEPALKDWRDRSHLLARERFVLRLGDIGASPTTWQAAWAAISGIGVCSVVNLSNFPQFFSQVTVDEVGAACGVGGVLAVKIFERLAKR